MEEINKDIENINNEIKVEENKPKKWSFKEYYHANPEFRARHLAKSKEHVECECGKMIIKANISKHKKSVIHEKIMKGEIMKINKYDKLLSEIEALKKLIKDKP